MQIVVAVAARVGAARGGHIDDQHPVARHEIGFECGKDRRIAARAERQRDGAVIGIFHSHGKQESDEP